MKSDKSNKLSYDKEIGYIDLIPKSDPKKEKERIKDIDNAVSEFLLETRGLKKIPEDEIANFDE